MTRRLALSTVLLGMLAVLSTHAAASSRQLPATAAGSQCIKVTDAFEERVAREGDIAKSVDLDFTVPACARVEVAGSCNDDEMEMAGLALTLRIVEPTPKPKTKLFGTAICRGLRFSSLRLTQIRPAATAINYVVTFAFEAERVHNRCDASSEAVFLRIIAAGVVETYRSRSTKAA
jgi:hypothetical protein